jgi:hypothetical protein
VFSSKSVLGSVPPVIAYFVESIRLLFLFRYCLAPSLRYDLDVSTEAMWRSRMKYSKAIKSAIVRCSVAVATLALLTAAMLTFETPTAMATPAIAKGQPCTTCHAGSPPSKSNLNDTGKKNMPK